MPIATSYDTGASRFVTIDDLSVMVRDNIFIHIVDATNRFDIIGLRWFRLFWKLSLKATDCCPEAFQDA